MPKGPPKRSTAPRDLDGMFPSTQSHPNTSGSSDESKNFSSGSDSDIGALESDSELQQDSDYTEDWEVQPQPTTFEERRKINEEKRARIAAKKPCQYPEREKARTIWCWRNICAHYPREIQEAQNDFKNGTPKISHEELWHQLEAIKSQGSSGPSGKKQQNIAGMAQKRPWAASILSEDDIQRASGMSSSTGRSKKLTTAPVPEEERRVVF
ncbi:hypothetical protein DFH09DRAFT_1091862 [Mycena vulgaris]|nr:hypothetical protein DFH09DRAFT_1091862 [Mycena vulgaris]